MERIKESINKLLTKEIILYIIFGAISTVINLGCFHVMANILKWNENISNFIAILLAIIFSYFTNKDMVFHSNARTLKEKLMQFVKFIAGRAFTMAIEMIGGYFLFQLPISNIISKIILTIIVIILNFFISKFFAFNKSNLKK